MATTSQLSSEPALDPIFFWEQYKTTIIAVIAVVVLGGVGYAGFRFYAEQQASNAAALLAGAVSPADYQHVIDRYPGSQPAASAYLLLAEMQRGARHYAEANATLHKFIDQFPKHALITTAWMAVAANLDSLGKADEALSTYQRLVAEYPQSFNAPLAMLSELPLLKAKNRTDEARRVCETVLTQYRDSILANEAIRELRSLPKAPQANNSLGTPSVKFQAGTNPPPLLTRPAPSATPGP